jgi:hypothetical protein
LEKTALEHGWVAWASRSRNFEEMLDITNKELNKLWRPCHNAVMRRTTIVAPADLLKRLRRMAAERGSSMADLIREALEEKVGSARPKPRSIGLGASGHADTAQRAGDERPVPRSWR